MPDLPPEDQPDTIEILGITIPIIDDDDPRFVEERAAWSRATAKAQAMHSPDDLVTGMEDDDWRVRHEVVDRLLARAGADDRTLPALLRHLGDDPDWQVRDAIAVALVRYAPSEAGVNHAAHDTVAAGLMGAENDAHPEVRTSVRYALSQFGLRPLPEG